jgi:hypothetical protein
MLTDFLPLLLLVGLVGLFWAKARQAARNPVPVPLVPPEYKGPLAFFRRHYEGDYSLGRSYFVNTLLVSLFAPVLGLVLIPWLSENFPARYASAGFIFITVSGLLAWFWAVSGTWASASKHVQRGGRSFWAGAAKFVIVMGALKTASDIAILAPSLKEHLSVAMGAQFGPDTKLEVRADGRSILLSGGINDRSAEQLEKALQMTPAVTTVVFSSEGGWIREGQMLAKVIRERGLNTYVEAYCASACTIAFLAGRDRAAAPSARIGFHASRGVGSLGAKPSSEEARVIEAIYRAAGLPDAFVRRALDTPHDRMWYPSSEELMTARVLTRRSAGGETAAWATSARSREEVAAAMRGGGEVYASLAERWPQDFERLVDAAWSKLQRGATDAEVQSAASEQLAAALQRLLPLAKDATLISYQALVQEQLQALSRRDPKACVEMAFPTGQRVSLVGILPPDLLKREVELMARVFREADPALGVKPSQQALDRVARRAFEGMTAEQVSVFASEAERRRSPAALTCEAAIAFFAGLNAFPAQERGRAIRMMYSGT